MSRFIKKKASFLSRIIASVSYLLIKLYMWTLRVTIHSEAHTITLLKNLPSGAVLLLWHDSILLLPLLHTLAHIKPFNILISYSKDGDIPSEIAKRFSHVEVIRVGHSSRQIALRTTINALINNHLLIITPDGPRGPCHTIKEGCLFAASSAKAPIIPVVWSASKQIRLNSWDRFKIPLPFSKVHLSFLPECFLHHEKSKTGVKKNLEIQMEREESRLDHLLCD